MSELRFISKLGTSDLVGLRRTAGRQILSETEASRRKEYQRQTEALSDELSKRDASQKSEVT